MATEYTDDPTISDEAILWRRIPPGRTVFDNNLGRVRPATDNFKDDPDGKPMSVALADLCNGDPAPVLAGHEGFALARFSAGLARKWGQKIVRSPEQAEPWHALVVGKKTDGLRKAFCRQPDCWEVPPKDTA